MLTRRQSFKTLAGLFLSSRLLARGFTHAASATTPSPDVARSVGAIARDESFWRWVQAAFEVDRSILNLNNGGVCPASNS